MDNVPVDVAACNLFARKLNFFARAALPLLSIIAAVSAVAGATGLSRTHTHTITISLAACNRGACSGMSSTCANTGSNKQAAEGTVLKLSLFTSTIG